MIFYLVNARDLASHRIAGPHVATRLVKEHQKGKKKR